MDIGVNINDILQVRVGTYHAGQTGLNTFFFRVEEAGIATTLEQIALDLDEELSLLYKQVLAGDASYYGVQVQRVHPTPKSVAVQSTEHIGPGLSGAEALPGQVAGVISSFSAFSGRKERGRIYVPFPSVEDADGTTNAPTNGYKGDLTLLGDTVYGPNTGGTGDDAFSLVPVIFHRGLGTASNIVGFVARQRWGTQRSRSSYGALNAYPPF